jgi:hypothetical protein
MTADNVLFDDAQWTAPPPVPRRWGGRETAAAVAIAALIGGLGGAAIYAATGHTQQFPMGRFGPGFEGDSHPGQGGAAQTSGPALHGQMVVPDAGGHFSTVVIQTGTVTAATPASVTVRSADGFSQTYTVPAGLQVPAVDEPVTLRAVQDGSAPVPTPRLTEITGTRPGPADPP